MKRAIAAVAIAGVMVVVWQVWAKYEARRSESEAQQAKRDFAYQAELARFQRDLRLGIPRSEVKSYLNTQKVPYNEMQWDFEVRIGHEPSNEWFCDHFDVYIDMEFTHLKGQSDPSPFDNLDNISVRKRGTCL